MQYAPGAKGKAVTGVQTRAAGHPSFVRGSAPLQSRAELAH